MPPMTDDEMRRELHRRKIWRWVFNIVMFVISTVGWYLVFIGLRLRGE